MGKKSLLLIPLFLAIQAFADEAKMQVLNLAPGQAIVQGYMAQVRITAAPEVKRIDVFKDNQPLPPAHFNENVNQYQVLHTFVSVGSHTLRFVALDVNGAALAESSHTVTIVPQPALPPTNASFFNKYIMKAVDQLYANYGHLGYDINSQLTHDLEYGRHGTIARTNGALTMCVSAVLEVIVTAMQIQAQETGSHAVFDFLPLDSWRKLLPTAIKAHIWVDEKNLKSYGTADAILKFKMGQHARFEDLEPGSFMNLNYTDGGGHAVVFVNYIDAAGNLVPRYNNTVVGFRYFSAQGRRFVGLGGLSYRHAFFSKSGCPEVPYARDCNVIYSTNQKLMNVGKIWAPKDWGKRTTLDLPAAELEDSVPRGFRHRPSRFDGLTKDD